MKLKKSRIFRAFHYLLLLFLTSFFSYFIFSFILLFFPSSSKNTLPQTKTIYLYSDLAHTEIIFPIKDLNQTFLNFFKPYLPLYRGSYLAFSYGDQNFMLHTPTWSDLRLKDALPALFLNTPGVIRVGAYHAIREDESVKKVNISSKTLSKLQQNILTTFDSKNNQPISLTDQKHKKFIYYFKSTKPYNLFYTCNSWSGEILRKSGISRSYWTPLAYQVVYGL